jgi:tRNA acetyltransferase TAN1
MRDLFNEYAEKMYPEVFEGEGGDGGEGDGEVDIEKRIQAELNEMKKPAVEKLFTHVRVNLQCGTLTKPKQVGSIAS